MMMAMRCGLGIEFRLEQRLELRAPIPPDAVRGLEGMRVADQMLKKYAAVGLLIGGLAKEAWRGSSTPANFSRHKDVDVMVLQEECERHPQQWEAGVDWWISHRPDERFTNGTGIGLIWSVTLGRQAEPASGLYLPSLTLLRNAIRRERVILGKEFIIRGNVFSTVKIGGFPILSAENIGSVWWGSDDAKIASHCKPC